MSNDGKTIPKDYVFKPGDRVELVVEVVCCDISRPILGGWDGGKDGRTCEAKFNSGCRAFLHKEDLRTGQLLPRALRAGDRVIPKATRPWIATITAVDGEWAWFRYRDNSRGTAPITELELVP